MTIQSHPGMEDARSTTCTHSSNGYRRDPWPLAPLAPSPSSHTHPQDEAISGSRFCEARFKFPHASLVQAVPPSAVPHGAGAKSRDLVNTHEGHVRRLRSAAQA